jgi:hypothetical protein
VPAKHTEIFMKTFFYFCALGKDAAASFTNYANSLVLLAVFRGVTVDVVIGRLQNTEVRNDVVFREIQARDSFSIKYGN